MKKALSFFFAVVLVFSLFACAKPPAATPSAAPESSAPPAAQPSTPTTTEPASSPSENDKYGGVIKLVCTAEGANPIGVPWEVFGVDTALLIPACETLMFQKTNGEVVPWLAESYKVDMDNKQIVFQIRQGVKFSDGTELNADVVVWNLEQMKAAVTLSTAVTAIEKLGEYEVALKFETFSKDILGGLSGRSNAMISKASFDKNGVDWARENPVGTGPFVLQKYVHGGSISYVRNENYWQEGKPYLDGIEFVFMRDVMTQNVAFQADGDQSIDVLNTTNGEQIALLRDMGYNVSLMPIGPISLVPSSEDTSSPLSKIEIRQAISYALDRESIVGARGFGVLTPAYQFIGDNWYGHLPDSYNSSYNLEKAKELMAQAGYPDGFSTTLYAQPALADKDAAVAIQSMLEQIGIKAELEFPDSGGYSALRKDGWDGILIQHTRSLPEIVSTFNFYFGTTINLLSSLWYPEDMEAAILAAKSNLENKEQLETLSKMVSDNTLLVPVYNLMDGWVAKTNIKGAEFTKWGSSTMFLPHEIYLEG